MKFNRKERDERRGREEREGEIYLLVVISRKSILHRKEECLFVGFFFFFIKEKIEWEEELLNELFLPSVTKT